MGLRILLTHVYAWPEVRRGGERYLHEVGAALASSGHEVRIVSTAPHASRARIRGVDVTYLKRRELMPKRFGDLSAEVAFGATAGLRYALGRFDVWHALGTADAASSAILGSVRNVRSVYTDLGISERSWRERRPDRRLYDLVVKRIDRYVALSESAAEGVRRDYGRRVDVLGGGVQLDSFRPAVAREPIPTLLFTSVVDHPLKNFPLLLDALGVLRERVPQVKLWLAGPGEAGPALGAAPARARDAVVRLGVGELADLPGLYGRAWTTVLPSRGEAFGLVALESLACGTPIVTLDHGGASEMVRPGVGARAQATAGALADAIEKALSLAEQRETADRCRAAAEPYDWRTGIVPRLERIYGEG
ncbi:MAG TPA: glycosyltransferase family 4 protein [Actinomycetota bacterium]|nr:glycosyltransferase family 4 protein [Actinomycetota bacterium]